ncbi:MAG: hypothetical protein WKG03_08685 [Telluria sp.]
MHLPELEWQFIYGRLAWGIVLATLALTLWPRKFPLARRAVGVLLAGMIGVQALPGAASPTYWLGLAFQWPSGLLVGLCLARLYLAGATQVRDTVMPKKLALVLAVTGIVLYLDAIGLIAAGLYYWGFGPKAAPLLALLLAAGSALAVVRDTWRVQACALLFAIACFTILRLPTGNLWDALLDPLLWGWALVTLARQALGRAKPTFAPNKESSL